MLKKTPSKVAQKNSNTLFFLTAWAAQMAQREEFMFQNVAYRPTVYKTGCRATTEPHRQKFKMTTDYWSGTQNVFGIFIKVCL